MDPSKMERLVAEVVAWLPKLASSAVLLLVFIALSTLGARLFRRLLVSRLSEDVADVLANAVRITLILFGAISALGTLGIDVSALVAGLGLTGFALGFALKDVISNVLAGIMVLMYKPFRRTDVIQIGDLKGIVQSIDLRYTRLRSDNDREILIPNSALMTSNIILHRTPAAAPVAVGREPPV